MNVVVFGVDESPDMSVWRKAVTDAFCHIVGHDVAIDDLFRIGRYTPSKVRPIIVRLHSAWDRRLVLSSSFKLKNYDGKMFVMPDEPLDVRRKRQMKSMKPKAEREGKTVLVTDGVLSVNGAIVFSVADGIIRHDG